MEKYYQFSTTGNKAEIYIYGDITDEVMSEDEVSAKSFRDELNSLYNVSEIELRIQSYGGSVFAGLAIYNMLKSHSAVVTAHIDGIAASISSVIAMSADKIVMPQNSMMMIHNPMTVVSYGNSEQLRSEADTLDKIRETSINAYLEKSNNKIERDLLIQLLDQETWLTSEECLAYGLCDEIVGHTEIAAHYQGSKIINQFKNLPKINQKKKEDKKMSRTISPELLRDLSFVNREENKSFDGSSGYRMTPETRMMRQQKYQYLQDNPGKTEEELLTSLPGFDLLIQKIAKEERALIDEVNNFEGENNMTVENKEVKTVENKGVKAQILTPSQKVVAVNNTEFGDEEYSKMSIGKLVKGMATGNWSGAELEQKVVAGNRDGSGGTLIPTPLSSELINMVRANSVLMTAGARTVPMDSSTLTFAKQTGDIKPHWKKEGDAINPSDPDFAPVVFTAKTLVGMSDISIELLEDAMNIDEIITESLVNSLSLELDRVGLLGAGTDVEPLGLYNRPGITKTEVGKELEGYKDISKAVTNILSANGLPNGILYSPRTYGELDALTDSSGQPLNAPKSYENLQHKLTTTQIPNDLGTDKDGSFAVVGDFSKLWYGIRTGITIEVSRVAGDAFSNLKYQMRAYLRADVQTVHEPHFMVIDDIK